MKWPWVSRLAFDMAVDRYEAAERRIEALTAPPAVPGYQEVARAKKSKIEKTISDLAPNDPSMRTYLSNYAATLKKRGKSEADIIESLENDWISTPIGEDNAD